MIIQISARKLIVYEGKISIKLAICPLDIGLTEKAEILSIFQHSKTMHIPLIYPHLSYDHEEAHEILQSSEHTHQHFQVKQNQERPLCRTVVYK